MDQVSPALQFGLDTVETCSWESSSPQPCLSPSDSSTHPGGSSPLDLVKPEVYSVMTIEGGNPSNSRDSTAEPLTPANLQILHGGAAGAGGGGGGGGEAIACKEEQQTDTDYDCGMSLGTKTSKTETDLVAKRECYNTEHSASTLDSIDTFGGYQNQPIGAPLPPPPPSASSMPSTSQGPAAAAGAPSAAGAGVPAGEGPSTSSRPPDLCSIPQCLKFGTFIPPEQQNTNILLSLEGADLWHQFYQVGTEMIITKSGRRMFPGIVISIGGLEPEMKYTISLEFNPVDNARYKYINTKWVNIGKAEAHCEELLKYVHPESPSTGKHWMSSKISFKKIKVTNNKNHKKGQVVALNSMHKYQPRVVVSKFISKRNIQPIFTHDLVECTFIGVTAYQNDQVTQLKIDHNPFAKAFRESGSDNDSYGYGMMSSWPPLSPLLSPYGAASTSFPEGQSLPMLSPSCIPPAGASPLPQFNSAFGNWESPPYSPALPPYRTPFPNAGGAAADPHARQVIPTRLMTQESPPISPLLYSPSAFAAAATGATPPGSSAHHLTAAAPPPPPPLPPTAHHHQQQQQQIPAAGAGAAGNLSLTPPLPVHSHHHHPHHQYLASSSTSVILPPQQQQQQQHMKVQQVPEMWTKSDYPTIASTMSVSSLSFEMPGGGSGTSVGYTTSCHPSLKSPSPSAAPQSSQQQDYGSLAKLEPASSPGNQLQMDIQP